MQNSWSVECKRENEIVGHVSLFNICYNNNNNNNCIRFYYNIIFPSKLCTNFCLISLLVVNFVP